MVNCWRAEDSAAYFRNKISAFFYSSLERKRSIFDAARSSTPIILKTCSVHLSYLLLKLMVPALRIVLNESSEKVKTTVLISHPVTDIQANLASRWYSIVMPFLSAVLCFGLHTSFQQGNMGNRISQRNLSELMEKGPLKCLSGN